MDLHARCLSFLILVALRGCALTTTTLADTFPGIHYPDYQITFFMHDDLLTVTNPSASVLTLPVGPGYFGTLVAFDDLMTNTPDVTSYSYGRCRGFYLYDANDNLGPGFEFVWTAYFDEFFLDTEIPAKSITFAGFDRTTDQTREISVVGGTGSFRYASGYAVINTYSRAGFATVLNITAYITFR